MADLVVRSRRTVTPEGERPAAVVVTGGRIVAVDAYAAVLDAAEEVDLGDTALLPGLVDTHVHVNEPGRTEWEGFATATRAAAAGGVTALIDMPLNSLPPTVTVDALRIKRAAASGQCFVDVGFWGGAIPGNAGDLPGLHDGRGVRLQGVPGRFRGARVPAGRSRPAGRRAGRRRGPVRRARRGSMAPARRRVLPALRGLPGVPAARRRARRGRDRDRRGPLRRPAGAHPAPVFGDGIAVDQGRESRGGTRHRGNLPALPDPGRRPDPARRHRVQVLPADPRRRQRRPALGRPGRGPDHVRGERPFAVHARPETLGHR